MKDEKEVKGVAIDQGTPGAPVLGSDGQPVKRKDVAVFSASPELLARIAREMELSGEQAEAERVYALIGKRDTKVPWHQKPVKTGTAAIVGGVVATVTVNEIIGHARHRKGKAWPTLLDGYRPPVAMPSAPVIPLRAASSK